VLAGDELIEIRKLAELVKNIFRWFDVERRTVYNGLVKIIDGTYYEKGIVEMIDDVVDESGQVKDNASDELQSIRMSLYRKRNELRKVLTDHFQIEQARFWLILKKAFEWPKGGGRFAEQKEQ
jgi:DNA mismatch repair protein MutS2